MQLRANTLWGLNSGEMTNITALESTDNDLDLNDEIVESGSRDM